MFRILLLPIVLMPFAILVSPDELVARAPQSSSFAIEDATAQNPVQQTIEGYVQTGLMQNPRIEEVRHRIDAIRYQIPQVRSLPDPVLGTSTYLAPVQTAAGEQRFGLGVNQKFVNRGRRNMRAAVLADEAQAAQADLVDVRLEVAESIRVACLQLLYWRKAIEITREEVDSLSQIGEVIIRQYEVQRSVTQQDVINVQIEQSRLENQLTTLLQKEKSGRARLTRLLGLETVHALPIQYATPPHAIALNAELLIAQALAARPDLQAQLALIGRDRKKICLANLEGKPDLTIGLNWIATSSSGISPVANGDDALVLGVGFNLPIYKDRIRAGVCQAKSEERASSSKLLGMENRVAEEVFDLVARAESASQTLQLIAEDIIPKSQRSLDLAIAEYANGEIAYVQLIENWRTLLRIRLTRWRMTFELGQTLASLDRSLGNLWATDWAAPVLDARER